MRPSPDAETEDTAQGAAQPGMQALVRGLAVVDVIASAARPPRFSTLLAITGLTKATLHRILQTLVDERYVRLDPRDQSYRLGARPFELAHRVWDQFDLRGAAEPEMVRLRDLTQETVRLGILDSGQVLYIDQREALRPVRIANGVGSRAAIHASALGKAIVSHLAPDERRALVEAGNLTAFTDRTITHGGDLDQQLNIIKARGYAVSIEEQHEGVSAVAAPILDHRAQPLGAIGVIGPAFRLSEEALHALGRDVMEAARRIAGNVGEVAMSINANPRPMALGGTPVRCVIPGQDFLGEGPYWDAGENRLHWVDILAPALVTGDPARGERQATAMPELVSAVIPRRAGGMICATESGIKCIEPDGSLSRFSPVEEDLPGNRLNDAKCDSQGRLWVGSLSIDTTPGKGALWRVDPDGSAHKMDSGFQVSNGIGWSPDDRLMYFADSGARTIWVYDFDAARGEISNRRVFVRLDSATGSPDGLAVDTEGGIWSAIWDGWNVTRFLPDGSVDRMVSLPVPRPTSVAFGGADLDTLFVTTARIRLSAPLLAEAPLSGSVLAFAPGVRGQPVSAFAG